MRRVSAISDYLESARKGKMEGALRKREEKGVQREREEKEERASYGLLQRLQAIRQTASDFLQSQHMAD